MSKQRNPTADYAIYLVVRLFVCLVQALPWTMSRGLARGLAWLFYRVDKRHRLVALENLRHAFPNRYTDAELDELVRKVYLHFCTLLIEIIQLPRMLNPYTWRRHMEMPKGREVVDALLSGRPLMFVTGHFGNWEFAGYALSLLGFSAAAVARPLDNPYLDDFLRNFRERTGQKILAKKGDFESMQALLDKGGVLATLGDQDAGERGLFVDFFNRPASTHKAIALMSLEHQVPLVVTGARKIGEPTRYQLVVTDIIYPEEYKDRPDAVKAMTQRYTTALENLVRTAPEQYFWLHRRWKHQPKAKKKKVA